MREMIVILYRISAKSVSRKMNIYIYIYLVLGWAELSATQFDGMSTWILCSCSTSHSFATISNCLHRVQNVLIVLDHIYSFFTLEMYLFIWNTRSLCFLTTFDRKVLKTFLFIHLWLAKTRYCLWEISVSNWKATSRRYANKGGAV